MLALGYREQVAAVTGFLLLPQWAVGLFAAGLGPADHEMRRSQEREWYILNKAITRFEINLAAAARSCWRSTLLSG